MKIDDEIGDRLRAALPPIQRVIRLLATDTDFWFDNHWIIGSTRAGRAGLDWASRQLNVAVNMPGS
ncbi:hypothetical protein ACFYZM_28530 [Streptomyces nondiastaticus]|uniref:Uncharacterized protein n=1 Tax=Streptomyces nondiastaticus TaxID=3154512 RepID=A0ABW6U6Q6_9ACTN